MAGATSNFNSFDVVTNDGVEMDVATSGCDVIVSTKEVASTDIGADIVNVFFTRVDNLACTELLNNKKQMSISSANKISTGESAVPPFPQTYNTLKSDTCDRQYDDQVNQDTYLYNSFLPSVWRPNMTVVQPMSRGSQPDFYGPLAGRRVTMESYLQGRGNILSKCPDAGVNYLPPELFSDPNLQLNQNVCTSTALEPTYVTYKKSCDSISNADVGQLTTGMPRYGQTNTAGVSYMVPSTSYEKTNMTSAPYKSNCSV